MDEVIDDIVKTLQGLNFEEESVKIADIDKETKGQVLLNIEYKKRQYIKALTILREHIEKVNSSFNFSKARSIVEKKIAKQEESIQLETIMKDNKEYILVPKKLFSIFDSYIS